MAIDDKIRYEKLQYDINRDAANQLYRQVNLINMNSLQAKTSFHLIKVE